MTEILSKFKNIFKIKGEVPPNKEPKDQETTNSNPSSTEETKLDKGNKSGVPKTIKPPVQQNRPATPKKKPNMFLWVLVFMLLFFLIWGMFFTSKTYLGNTQLFRQAVANNALKKDSVKAEWWLGDYVRLSFTTEESIRLSDGRTYGEGNYLISFDNQESMTSFFDDIPEWTLEAPQPSFYTGPSWFWTMLTTFVPWIVVMVIAWVMIKKITDKQQGAGKIQKKSLTPQISNIKFNNVAGYKDVKQELVELVDFLKHPMKYQMAGARIPKGILLSGPPGTGKTLFAKAIAGEAGTPFYSISGSDFVEMFVGVGASRVRALFEVAKTNTPSLIFIDELDAVGRMRGAGIGGGNDEREQTLNQLLVELDGFQKNSGVLVIAATNRPDVLDPALTRPGRFDRSVQLRLPDIKERQWIIESYANVGDKKFVSDINWANIASRTPGFSGAELENVMNEAAILSIRTKTSPITLEIIDEAIDRVIGGPSKQHNTMTDEDKKLIAYHEAGHALIGLVDSNAEKVQKISIVPRGGAGGYVLMTPKIEKFVQTKAELLSKIKSYMGGRASEEIFFGENEITTGASNDIETATKIARKMVVEFGMSELGPIQYEKSEGSVFLGRDMQSFKNVSSPVQHEIDLQIRKIIDTSYKGASDIITKNKDMIHLFAEALLIKETLNSEETEEIFKTKKLPQLFIDMRDEKQASAKPKDKPAAEKKEQKDSLNKKLP